MRLSAEQITSIQTAIRSVLPNEEFSVGLFGSRLNDEAKGGDVDLVITTANPLPLRTKARIILAVESMLELPVDIVFSTPGKASTPFERLALKSAYFLPRMSK